MTKRVRVRFAPSPTGPLHMGGVRTALFNYLFAKKHGGDFLLRIEDTDQTRFVPGAEEYIVESLKWCGINFTEGVSIGGPHAPYRQSERSEIYIQYANQLIENGNAYYAFDKPEELDVIRTQYESEKKTFAYDANTRKQLCNSLTLSKDEVAKRLKENQPYVVRFKMPENEVVQMHDIIRGDVTVNTATLDDKVLFKSDGLPTYHLANVVDDYLMQISHVIRGEEWLPSLPLHILLYRALGWQASTPEFAHLPLILKPSGKGKLSKRDGDKDGFPVFPTEWKTAEGEIYKGYREEGYLPDAFINMLAFLGWNPGTEQEIFSLDELAQLFSLEKVGKAGARFDPEKAKWFNHQYLIHKDDHLLLEDFKQITTRNGLQKDDATLIKIISLVKERANFINDIWEQSKFFFIAPTIYDEKVIKKSWKAETADILNKTIAIINNCNDFRADYLKTTISEFVEKNELGFGAVMVPIRLTLVGGSSGPDLFTIIEVLGKEETIKRIQKGINTIQA